MTQSKRVYFVAVETVEEEQADILNDILNTPNGLAMWATDNIRTAQAVYKYLRTKYCTRAVELHDRSLDILFPNNCVLKVRPTRGGHFRATEPDILIIQNAADIPGDLYTSILEPIISLMPMVKDR